MKKTIGVFVCIVFTAATSSTFAFGTQGHDGEKKWDRATLVEKRQEHKAMMQKHKAETEAHKETVEVFVANNDFEGFKAMMEEMRVEKEAKREEEGKEGKMKEGEKEYTEEEKAAKIKAHFDTLVTYYEEHGSLEGMRHEEGMHHGKKKRVRKHYKASHGKIVRGMLGNMSEERMEKILDKIIEKLETVEISDIDDEKKEKIIDLLEGIAETINEYLAE